MSLETVLRRSTLPVFLSLQLLAPAVHAQTPVYDCGPTECMEKARTLDEQQDYLQAAEYLKKASAQVVEKDFLAKALMLYNIGLEYEKAGSPARAMDYFQLYNQENPAQLITEAQRRAADAVQRGDAPKVIDLPTEEDIDQRLTALNAYHKGKQFDEHGEFDNAINQYKTALVVGYLSKAGRIAIFRDLGKAFDHNHQIQEALRHYKLFLEQTNVRPERLEIEARVAELEKQYEISAIVVPPPKEKAVSPSYWQRHVPSSIAAGAAVIAGSVGVGLHFAARNSQRDLENSCGDMGCTPSQVSDLHQQFKVADYLMISSGVVFTVAATLFGYETLRPKHPKSVNLTPTGVKLTFP